MAMIVLATGAQVVAIQGGVLSYVAGVFDATAIDHDIATNGAASIPQTRLTWINNLILASGATPGFFSALQLQYGTRAYLWACVVDYMNLAATISPESCGLTQGEADAQASKFYRSLAYAKDQVCQALTAIGLTDSEFCSGNFDIFGYVSASNVKHY